MTCVRAIITPRLLVNVSFTSFANRKLFLSLSTLQDYDVFFIIHILVYAPEGRAFLE